MAYSIEDIKENYDRYRRIYAERDARMQKVLLVRKGLMRDVYPDLFPDGPFSDPIVANMVDIAARDTSEVIAPLPAFNCNSPSMVSETARKKADKREEIVNAIVDFSDLQTQMFSAADRYVTYGFVPAQIEIDYDVKMPRINFFDSTGCYPVMDRFGRVLMFFQRMQKPTAELMAEYPEMAHLIYDKDNPSTMSEIVRYHDKDQDVLFLPNRHDLILARSKNPIGKVLIRVVERPSLDGESRGQFDDVLAIQVAKARYALLSLEAATKSVQAPIAMGRNDQELALGPDAIIRSERPSEIRRIPLEIPQGAFAQQQVLEGELRLGSRYPESRTGNIDASIVTGRGVQALQAGFDTQIKAAQAQFARLFTDLVAMCFEVDEKVFGSMTKEIKGVDDGTPFNMKYVPSRQIDGNYGVDVRYGIMSGMDPNRAIIALLQMRSDKLVSRDYVRREIPMELNVTQEEQRVDIEEMRDSLRVAVAQYAQAIPALAAQGQDPSEIISRIAEVIQGRQKGLQLENVIGKAFAPKEQPVAPEMAMMPGAPGTPAAGAAPVGASQPTPEQGGAAPAAGPEQRPDIATLLASISGAA